MKYIATWGLALAFAGLGAWAWLTHAPHRPSRTAAPAANGQPAANAVAQQGYLDVDRRYARPGLGYVSPAVAQLLVNEPEQGSWRRRVAQDMSVLLGARTDALRARAAGRLQAGLACLEATAGKAEARAWLEAVSKAHLREPADVQHWVNVTGLVGSKTALPPENCNQAPQLWP